MTWGSHCPQCGREDCGWSAGDYCEGNTIRPPSGYRLRPAMRDFGYPGFFFYVEKQTRGWFRNRWREVEGCRSDTPTKAMELLREQMTFRVGAVVGGSKL